jgi:hypothetical protein
MRSAAAKLDIDSVVGRGVKAALFDTSLAFMLDITEISPIIYIWYEGGWLSPPVVTAVRSVGG